MKRNWMRLLGVVLMGLGAASLPACASETEEEYYEEDGASTDGENAMEVDEASAAMSSSEKAEICNAVTGRRWSQQDFDQLLNEVVTRYVTLKKNNDALVAQRGVGGYAGVRTEFWKAIAANDKATAIRMLEARGVLKNGAKASDVVNSMKATSCIGRVYSILGESYRAIGRADEWAQIERCGRAWNSSGVYVQQALIKNGWPAPALAFATDATKPPTAKPSVHNGLVTAALRGSSYFGVPLSKTMFMRDFLPTPGSSAKKDERLLLELGKSTFLSVGTMHGAYHVPILVPARLIPTDLAPAGGAARKSFLDAHARNEPFILESHSLRQAWDPTNFEIRPFTDVIKETFGQGEVYSTGTLLMAPHSSFVVPR